MVLSMAPLSTTPYAAAPSTDAGAGGDGFDLSWAVKADGTPIALSSVRYVRVYSAVLFSAGVFGETSAEVCGLYVANAESSSVGTTSIGSVAIDGEGLDLSDATAYGNNTFYLDAEIADGNVITVTAASGANVFINGVESNTFTVSNTTNLVQVLVQVGNAAPYILVLD